MKKWMFAMLVVVTLALLGTGATAFAAGDSLPGETLYPVKLEIEDLRMGLTGETEAQVDLALDQAGERIGEMIAMRNAGSTVPEESFTRLAYHLNAALSLAAGQQDEDIEATLNHIHQRLQDQDRTMSNWQDGTPGVGDPLAERARSMLRERLHIVEDGLLDAASFRATVQQRYQLVNSAGPGAQVGFSTPSGNGNSGGADAGGYGPGTPAGDGAPYGPGDCTATCTPVQDGTGPGYGPGSQQTPYSYGPGPSTTATPVQDGTGPGPGPMTTPGGGNNQNPDPSCTPAQDGTGPGPGPVGTPKPSGGGK